MGYVGTDVEPPFEKIPMAKIIWDVRMNPETLILRIK
jgi:hypothetical protein